MPSPFTIAAAAASRFNQTRSNNRKLDLLALNWNNSLGSNFLCSSLAVES